jgi:glycosyltransferase involved in cell wall biosynthesis
MNSDIQFIIIGHLSDELIGSAPSNMEIIRSDSTQTDTAIPYSALKEFYSGAIAICIPLNDDPEDTCGYTELLESMAMAKPVIKAKTGCLDINVDEENIGFSYEPHNPNDLNEKIKLIINNPEKAQQMGINGKRLIDKRYNLNAYNLRINTFIKTVKLNLRANDN